MGLKLKDGLTEGITPAQMEDGDIGVIVSWLNLSPLNNLAPIGYIVQRYKDSLIVLGRSSGESYKELTNSPGCRVKILPKGTIIEIT